MVRHVAVIRLWGGAEVFQSRWYRKTFQKKTVQNENLLAKIIIDTAENGRPKDAYAPSPYQNSPGDPWLCVLLFSLFSPPIFDKPW